MFARLLVIGTAAAVLAVGCGAASDELSDTPSAADRLDAAADVLEHPEPIEVRDEQVRVFQHDNLVGRDGVPPVVDPLADGDLLRVVEGYQQANMIVVGFATDAALAEPLDVHLLLEVDGERHSEVTWAFQRSHATREGGWRSMYDLYLVLDGCKRFEEGSPGELAIAITDKDGSVYHRQIVVALERNDLCY